MMFLGLDLGTSGLRALIVDDDGEPVAEASHSYCVSNPYEGWSEQDPTDWIDACDRVMADLRANAFEAYRQIKGIGISGHMHGAVMLDQHRQAIRPCILWNDTRASKEAKILDEANGFRALTGNIVFPGFTAPKLLWMQRREPDNFAKIAHIMLPKDYLSFWLTGRFATDMSDAAGSSWLNVGERSWSNELIKTSGIERSNLPQLFEGCDIVGPLQSAVADQYGLSNDTQIVAGGADNACAACGIGAFDEGQGFASLGTSGVVLVARNKFAPDPGTAVHTFCHAVPEKYYQMGVTLSATDSLNWLAETMDSDPVTLAGLLPDKTNGPASVLFLPYLSGERTPHNDSDIRGSFIGLSKQTDRTSLVQAIMEGVCYSLRDCLEALKTTGANPTSLMAVGGGTKSEFWLQSLANILNIDIEVPKKGDFGAALGAARLAMMGAGKMSAKQVMTKPKIERLILPDPNLQPLYETKYQTYKKCYLSLKGVN